MIKKAFIINAIFLISSMIIALYAGGLIQISLLLVAVYMFVAYSSECRGNESIWIFMLVAVGLIPVNIALEIQLYDYVSAVAEGLVGKMLSVIVFYAVIFSIEEIVAGLIGRIIWRHQSMDK